MTFFTEPNQDAFSIAPDAAATGPRVGFLEGFEVAYQSQVRGSAMFGIEKAMHELDVEQVRNMRRAGIEDVPALSDDAMGFFGSGAFSGDYMDTARFHEQGGDPEVAKTLEEYDTKINTLRERYPDLRLRTSREMWDEVRGKAQEYERRAMTQRLSWGGTAGGLAGAVAGALNLESDPFNFATIPLGGAGSTIARRVIGQGAAQGVIESINQITGVQGQRELLGLEHGFGDAVMRVGGAALGGAALQGLGEGIVAGARRFFRNTPNDPAPVDAAPAARPPLPDTSRVPPGVIPADPEVAAAKLVRQPQSYIDYLTEVSPLAATRLGRERTVLELDTARTQLEDWSGPFPFNLDPNMTDARINLPRGDFTAPAPTIFDRVADASRVDEIARQIDRPTFRYYDRYADANATYRQWLEQMKPVREQEAESALAELNGRIYDVQERMARSGAMKAKKQAKELQALVAERDAAKEKLLASDTLEMAQVRRAILRNDEKMRELAPLVSRAYARARKKWDNTDSDRVAIRQMILEGRKTAQFVDEQAARVIEATPATLYDRAPILRQAARIQPLVKNDADAADVAAKIIEENAKVMEEAIEAYKASTKALITQEGEAPEITIAGTDYKMHLDNDTVWVPNEDGTGSREISIRQLLEEQDELEVEVQAVTSCSIR